MHNNYVFSDRRQEHLVEERPHEDIIIELSNLRREYVRSPHEQAPPLTRAETFISIIFPAFMIYSLTFGLFMTNCFVWIAQNLVGAYWLKDWKCVLLMFQGKWQPDITYGLQIWRLVVSSFAFKDWKMFIMNNFALNMLGYSIEKESYKRFLVGFYISIVAGNMASCIFQPANFIWVGCSSGTIGLLPLELYRYLRYRHLPELRRRLIFLIVNFAINLGINIESLAGPDNIDWVNHLAAFIAGMLLILALSDYTVMPPPIQRQKYILKKLAGILTVGGFVGMSIFVFLRYRVKNVGRYLYGNTCV